MCSQQDKAREAPRWIKWVVSAVIAAHFFAILSAVTGLGVGYAPPPRLCAEANQKFAPYLELVFLQNPYRFYAPNPGCDPTIWIRIRYSDGRVQWLDFPHVPNSAAPVLRQRLLAMPRSAVETVPAGQTPEDVILSPSSQICLASYVRGLVRSNSLDSGDGLPVLTEDVEVYRIDQRCMLPFEARDGWQFTDLRLRTATCLGTFFVNGKLQQGPRGTPTPMPGLAAQIIHESVTSGIQPASLSHSTLPRPIVALLQQHPDLVRGSDADLAARVQQAIEGETFDSALAVHDRQNTVPTDSMQETAFAASSP